MTKLTQEETRAAAVAAEATANALLAEAARSEEETASAVAIARAAAERSGENATLWAFPVGNVPGSEYLVPKPDDQGYAVT